MSKIRPLTRALTHCALLGVLGLCAGSRASAAEMLVIKPGARPLAEIGPANGAKSYWLDAVPVLAPMETNTGLLISVPVDLSGLDCQGEDQGALTLLTIDGDAHAFDEDSDDVRGLSALTLTFYPKDGVIGVKSTVRPLVAGKRATQPLTYEFKIPDRFSAPARFCSANPVLGPHQFNFYLSASSFVVEAIPRGAGLGQTYLSPVNMGLGDTMWINIRKYPDRVILHGRFGRSIQDSVMLDNRKVKIWGVNWTSSATDAPQPGLYNLKDSLNYYYGARAFPTRSPTLTQPRAAAALIAR